jgi:hypothetical protein
MERVVERYHFGELKLIDLLVAVLLERGGPVAPEEAGARLAELGVTHWRGDLGPILKKSMAPSPEVTTDEEGRFAFAILDPNDHRLAWRLRSLQPPAPRPAGAEPPSHEELERRWREKRAAERAEAAALRRVLLHAAPGGRKGDEAPGALALLDAASREIETFVDDELAAVPGRLAGYDLVIGISPRPLLRRLGLDADAFKLADLDRPQKTRRIDKRGRILKLTNEMLISATVGTSRPLGEEAKYREYLEKGHLGRLRRRLEADVKTLWSYYRYGVLHGGVSLRWGFLDEMIPCQWAEPGDPSVFQLMREAWESDRRVEVVAARPPAWGDPWGRSMLCDVVPRGAFDFVLCPLPGQPADSGDIFEARLEDAPPGFEVMGLGKVLLRLSRAERAVVLRHNLLLEPDLARKLRFAQVGVSGAIEIGLDPDELERLGGHVVAAAAHAKDEEIGRQLDRLYGRIASAERLAAN